MTLIFVFILVLIFSGTIHLHLLNPNEITLHLSEQLSIEMPVILIALWSVAMGIGLVFFINSLKGISGIFKKIDNRLTSNRKKRLRNLFTKGHRYWLSDEIEKAEKTVRKLLNKDPDNANAHHLMGKICQHKGELKEAVEFHSKAKILDESSLENLYSLVTAYEKVDRLNDALEILGQIQDQDKESRLPLERMRNIFLKRGEIDKAVESQKKFLHMLNGDKKEERENDRLAWLTYRTGVSNTRSEDLNQNMDIYKGIIKSSPHFVPPYLKLGETLTSLDKEKEAIKLYKKGYETTKAFVILQRLLDLHQHSEDHNAIFEAYDWALTINPDAHYLSLLLGELYIRKGMPDKGIAEIKKTSPNRYSGILTHLALGRALELAGKEEESKREYHLAFKGGINDLVVYVCSFCDNLEREWGDICPKCGEFNTFEADIS